MIMTSGQRPFLYFNQPYPLYRIPYEWNASGILRGGYSGVNILDGGNIGQAWFSALAELRSFPSGHPNAKIFPYRCSGIVHVGSGGIHVGPSFTYTIEPDPSGTPWVSGQQGGINSGVPSHYQVDTFQYYIYDLRSVLDDVFTCMSLDYSGVNTPNIRHDYLMAYFPRNSGFYSYNTPSGFYDMDLAEVQYNVWPRIADIPNPRLDTTTNFYKTFTGGATSPIRRYLKDREMNCVLNASRYANPLFFGSIGTISNNDHGYQDFNYRSFLRPEHAFNDTQSSPFGGDKLPYSLEIWRQFGFLEIMGPVFPACQTINGQIVSPSGERSWFKDATVIGANPIEFQLDQNSVTHNDWHESYNRFLEADVNDLGTFCNHMHYNEGDVPSTPFNESTLLWILQDQEPFYGFDSSDLTIGYMAWAHSSGENTVRIDGQGLVPGVKFRVIDLQDRSAEKWDSNQGFIYHGSSNVISQSGAREVHIDRFHRNANVGAHWARYPSINNGFPSVSGEPLSYFVRGIQPEASGISGISPIQDRRVWFELPNLNFPDVGETPITFSTPSFADRSNVKKVCVEFPTQYSNGVWSSGVGSSGQYSVWPRNEEFQNGSGVGYHVMDKGIWIKKNPFARGMTLISPYNGQRLLFKKADDREIIWGADTGVWRKEVRPGAPFHWPEYFQGPQFYKRFRYFRDITQAQAPQLIDPHGTYVKEYSDERSYRASWYHNKEEQVPHTDGTYTVFNFAAESPSEKISRDDYLDGDSPFFWSRDSTDFDPAYPNYHKNQEIKYPFPTGFFHQQTGGPFGGGNPAGLISVPDFDFTFPYLKYSPLLSQSDFIGTFTASRESTYNKTYDFDDGLVKSDVEIYIAKKPYVQWNIPGLDIKRSGEATVDIGSSFLRNLLYEGLTPGFNIIQTRFLVGSQGQIAGQAQRQNAYNGYLVLKLEMFGLNESSRGGIVEGWGRFVETASAGITETIDPGNDGKEWPAYYEGISPDHILDLWEPDPTVSYGWYSVPRFNPAQWRWDNGDSKTHASLYGSRLFRVWFNPDVPDVIHCVDDVWEGERYGLLIHDNIYRYDIADKDGNSLFPIYATREGQNFLVGSDYKDATKCIKSITWTDDEMIAAAELYEDKYKWRSIFNEGRAFEIATLTTGGIFDNDRANMIFREPGRQWAKPRPLFADVGTEPWTYADPYMYCHYGYGTTINPTYPFYDYQEFGQLSVFREDWHLGHNARISAYSSELSAMWPKIVYTNIK